MSSADPAEDLSLHTLHLYSPALSPRASSTDTPKTPIPEGFAPIKAAFHTNQRHKWLEKESSTFKVGTNYFRTREEMLLEIPRLLAGRSTDNAVELVNKATQSPIVEVITHPSKSCFRCRHIFKKPCHFMLFQDGEISECCFTCAVQGYECCRRENMPPDHPDFGLLEKKSGGGRTVAGGTSRGSRSSKTGVSKEGRSWGKGTTGSSSSSAAAARSGHRGMVVTSFARGSAVGSANRRGGVAHEEDDDPLYRAPSNFNAATVTRVVRPRRQAALQNKVYTEGEGSDGDVDSDEERGKVKERRSKKKRGADGATSGRALNMNELEAVTVTSTAMKNGAR